MQQSTLMTSVLSSIPTSIPIIPAAPEAVRETLQQATSLQYAEAAISGQASDNIQIQSNNDSTINGVVIGLLSSFASAILIACIFLIVYFFKYTSSGRILLDRIGRPGEYDDEQAFAREEAEALEEMDDIQRTEYFRAKGMFFDDLYVMFDTDLVCLSIRTIKPTRFIIDRYFLITILGNSRKGCFCLGI